MTNDGATLANGCGVPESQCSAAIGAVSRSTTSRGAWRCAAVAAAETLQQVQAEARRQETRGALEQGGDAHPGQAAVLVGIGRPGAVEHRGRQRRQPRVVGALRESAHRMILCCT